MQRFQKGAPTGYEASYPFTDMKIRELPDSRFVNPKAGKSYKTKIPESFDIRQAALEIERVREDVKKGIYPHWFMEKYYPFEGECPKELPIPLTHPELANLSIDNPAGLANVVHMDNPIDMPIYCHKWLVDGKFGQKANVSAHTDQYINFLETIPQCTERISRWANRELDQAFTLKWYYGIARPEEILGYNCTAYPEGCPNHPTIPQGHEAAAAGGVGAIIYDFRGKLSDKQIKVLIDSAYLWGQFRCLAGVHYGIDAIMSLVISPLKKYVRKDVLDRYLTK